MYLFRNVISYSLNNPSDMLMLTLLQISLNFLTLTTSRLRATMSRGLAIHGLTKIYNRGCHDCD